MKEYLSFIKDFSDLIKIKSVKGAKEDGAPFGKGVLDALNCFLSIGKRMGFEVYNYDNYIGEIAFGSGEEIGVIGHVDVVPEGDGWNTPPFRLTEGEDRFFGRGTTDDKGPLLLSLYALKDIKDMGIENKRFRLFVGCDEESGWADIAYFNKERSFPKYGFSPDGNFPVCYAEKGPNKIVFKVPFLANKFTCFTAGVAPNAVPDYAFIKGPATDEELKAFNLKRNEDKIESFGKASHGAYPELGENAILPILRFLESKGELDKRVIKYLFDDELKIKQIGDETGYATLSPNVIKQEDGFLYITVDFRVPATMRLEDFIPLFNQMGMEYSAHKSRDPHFVDKENPFVQKLLNAYNEVLGKDEQPVSQRGGTFASVFKMGVAFGPEFKNKTCCIHEPNEFILKEDVLLLYKTYRQAFLNLTK